MISKERDFELTEIEKKRERELQELKRKTKELEEARMALMNILEDVEEARQRAEEEKNKTLAIISNFADGLLVFDKKGVISMVNPQAERMFRIKEEMVKGKNLLDLKRYSLFAPAVDLIFKKGKVQKVTRTSFSPKKEITIEVTVVPLKKERGEREYMAIFHDISREKTIERLKTEFVSLSAHQLRTPLSVIKWTLSLLREENLSEKEKKEFIEKLWIANERMIRLVNDLLNVTRIEEGRYLYNLQQKDIVEVSQRVIKPRIELAKKKGLTFIFKKPKKKIPKVKIDEEKISLCIQNLVENAINYTPPGGKVIVSIEYDKNKKEVLFSVKDTGIGIPQEQRHRIFTKFFRADNAVKMETEGSGLGLFITKNIINAHKGRIWFKSQENRGSTFYFSLPVA